MKVGFDKPMLQFASTHTGQEDLQAPLQLAQECADAYVSEIASTSVVTGCDSGDN